jgi:hypothetical protein
MTQVTSERVSRIAIQLLHRTLALPMTVTRVPADEFTGPSGGEVILRVPVPTNARTQDGPGGTITYDDINETPVTVGLEHIYHGTRVSVQARTLDIENFATQITLPQVQAVARGAEDELATVMNALPVEVPVTSAEDVDAAILEARATLGKNDVPLDMRWLAVSPDFATFLLGKPNLTPFDSPPTPTALTEARIGRYRGFTVVETNSLTGTRAVAYHQSGFAFGNVAPVRPEGATESSTATQDGISLRHIFLFDPNTAQDRSLVSTFAGASLVDADRVVVLGADDES